MGTNWLNFGCRCYVVHHDDGTQTEVQYIKELKIWTADTVTNENSSPVEFYSTYVHLAE